MINISNKHRTGYGVLKRAAQKRKKLLQIDLDTYARMKEEGCSACKGPITPRSNGFYLKKRSRDFTVENVTVLCSSCWGIQNLASFNYVTYSMARLRRGWNKTPPAICCLNRARQADGTYKCSKCLENFNKDDINLDHIQTVICLEKGYTTLDEFAKRLLGNTNNIQCLCIQCHGRKTTEEKKIRKEKGSIKKSKINKQVGFETDW